MPWFRQANGVGSDCLNIQRGRLKWDSASATLPSPLMAVD